MRPIFKLIFEYFFNTLFACTVGSEFTVRPSEFLKNYCFAKYKQSERLKAAIRKIMISFPDQALVFTGHKTSELRKS